MRVPTIVLMPNNFTNDTRSYTLYKEKTEAHEAFQYIEIACNGKKIKFIFVFILNEKLSRFSLVYI